MRIQQQRGSALISVMIILLLTTVLGVVAVRQGTTNLNLAMNNSVQTLLTTSSDVGFDKIERSDIAVSASGAGPLGYLRLEGNAGKEYIFCYRPTLDTKRIYNINKDTILLPNGIEGPATGFCKVDNPADYASGRRVVMSQIALVRPQEAAVAEPFEFYEKGTDSETVKRPDQQRYRAYVTSIAPSLARNASKAAINKCFENPNDDATVAAAGPTAKSTSDCLFDLGVPSNTQIQDYVLGGLVSVETI